MKKHTIDFSNSAAKPSRFRNDLPLQNLPHAPLVSFYSPNSPPDTLRIHKVKVSTALPSLQPPEQAPTRPKPNNRTHLPRGAFLSPNLHLYPHHLPPAARMQPDRHLQHAATGLPAVFRLPAHRRDLHHILNLSNHTPPLNIPNDNPLSIQYHPFPYPLYFT